MTALAVPTFDGQTVRLDYLFPDTGTVFNGSNILVGPGVDQVGFADRAVDLIDIEDDTITFDFESPGTWSGGAFNGPRFSDLNGTINNIVGFVVLGATNMVGFNAGLVSFTADSIQWNWQGLSFDSNTIVSVQVLFEQVPAPGTLLLLAGGLLGLGLRRRQS